ncbi:hypothetical protein [Methylomonas methanica]|uniref:Uncharacterized protein n=1 Tax=Methylomonas methanica (strain DSM 25384 / MC09) TaxID=857087 RepID=G0A0D8_METMM|nr:hypothetical protein [Methylomonas methanica]AEG02444.1 hypothetical protein Metme_4091 [Methylomonas methanica MC09]
MKNCPQCGQPRQSEEYKCPTCDVFYPQLDEILFAEQERLERNTYNGAIKRIRAAEDSKQTLRNELKTVWRNTPLKTKIVFGTIVSFVFVLVVPIF